MIIKTIPTLLFASCLFALCAGGCSSELNGGNDPTAVPGPNDRVPLSVQTSLDATVSDRTTRANVPNGGSIGVFCTTANGYTAQNNAKYTTNNGTAWSPSSAPIYLDGRIAQLCAYYPYGAVTFNGTVATLTAQKYEVSKDLRYAVNGGNAVCNKTPNATFAMKPAYARVILSIQRHATNYVSGGCAISNVAFSTTSNQFISNGTIDISDSALGGTALGAWSINPAITGIAAGATNTACDVLLPPQPIAAGLTLVLTIDGAIRSVSITANQFGNKLDSGKQYTISLIITDTEVLPDGNVISGDYGTDGTTIKNDTPKEL